MHWLPAFGCLCVADCLARVIMQVSIHMYIHTYVYIYIYIYMANLDIAPPTHNMSHSPRHIGMSPLFSQAYVVAASNVRQLCEVSSQLPIKS